MKLPGDAMTTEAGWDGEVMTTSSPLQSFPSAAPRVKATEDKKKFDSHTQKNYTQS